MNQEEFVAAVQTGSHVEPIDQWVPRAAAILLTLTLRAPGLITEDPERVADFLRQLTAKMPTEILLAATAGLIEIDKVLQVPGMTPELYAEIQSAFKDEQGE